ncbi:uncharacterized protein [Diadema antillarum]|uniref:uncharacterized protein n=1 Tax=Diadema antillarum TaxID=105358 RepID=UPI003A8C4542
MADYGNEVTLSDGRSISSLRVVDLKQELKKYGLSIAGSKSQLIERLKAQIELEEMKQAPVCEGGPNQGIVDDESVASNSFIQQYLKQQQELLKQRHAREVPTEDSVIPEGLTNQVEELNQSLSHSQSEEAEKVDDEREEKNGKDQPGKEAKPVTEEHSSGSRMSRRSRRQSAQQEEKEDRNAEVEQERKRSHRKRLKSRDSEQGNDDGMSHDRRLADEKNEDMKVTDGMDEETKPASEQDKDSKQPEKPAETDSPTNNDVTAVASADQEKESNEGEAPSAAQAEDAHEDSREEETEKSVEETSDRGSRAECEVESQPVRQGEVEQKRDVSRAEEPSEEKTDADQSTVAVPSQKEQKLEVVTDGRSETGHEICDEQAKSMPKEQGEQISDVVKDGHSEDEKMDTAPPVSEPAHREQRSETNVQMETGGNQEPEVEPGVESRDGNLRDRRDAAEDNSDQKEKKESPPQQHQESNNQRRVKLNRSGDLSRARGREVEKPDWKSEETGATVAENVEGLEKAKEESGSDALVERGSDSNVSPRKRPAWEKEEEDAINDESDMSSKRRKAEADGGDDVKPEQIPLEEEGGVPKEDKSSASGEMGKGEGRTAATSNTTETEDGEIKEEGEGTEEVAVEGAAKEERDAKEEKTEDQVPKVEQRSRVRPIITSSAPVKTKRDSFTSKDKAGDKDQGQEGSSDVKATSPAQASAPPVKKRRWGTTKKTSDDLGKNTNVNISTQLLKGIIPDIKVPPSEVLALEQEDELMDVEEAAGETQKGREVEKKIETEPAEEEPASNEPPKRKFIRQTITAPGAPADEESDIDYEDDEMAVRKVKQKGEGEEEGREEAEGEDESSDSSSSSSSGSDSDEDDEDGKEEGSGGEDGQKKKKKKAKKEAAVAKEAEKEGKPETKVVKMQRLKTAVRTVIDEPVRQTQREPSPSKRPESKIVHVINLVRPFTLVQLKELLGRYGTLTEGGFWINNIKSHCYATYETTEGAVACRASLHGTTWPSSNPKTLRIEFADQNELNRHMGVAVQKEEARAEPSPERTPAPVRGDRISAQDRERDAEQERRTRERERERERARKEREWDRGKERSQSRERRRRQRSQERRERHEEAKKEVEEPPAKLLDDLFRKTKATPCIYWLPLTEDMIVEREKQRAQRDQRREERAQQRKLQEEEERREMQRDRRGEKERERERPRGARYRSRSRDRRSRSRSRGRRR